MKAESHVCKSYALRTHCVRSAYAVRARCVLGAYALRTRCVRSAYKLATHCLPTIIATKLPSHGMYAPRTHCVRGAYAVRTRRVRGAYAVRTRCVRCAYVVRAYKLHTRHKQVARASPYNPRITSNPWSKGPKVQRSSTARVQHAYYTI